MTSQQFVESGGRFVTNDRSKTPNDLKRFTFTFDQLLNVKPGRFTLALVGCSPETLDAMLSKYPPQKP